MKNNIILSILSVMLVVSFSLIAQDMTETTAKTEPVFAEGKMTIDDFFRYYLTYPEKAASANITGVVDVEVFINKSGEVTKASVKKGLTPETNKEALRIINLFPKFTPAMKGNAPVDSSIRIKVPFPLKQAAETQTESKEPLYILDGKVVEGKISVEGDDIKSIRVLKGKQAVDKYGEKGKNGVVIFTTK